MKKNDEVLKKLAATLIDSPLVSVMHSKVPYINVAKLTTHSINSLKINFVVKVVNIFSKLLTQNANKAF